MHHAIQPLCTVYLGRIPTIVIITALLRHFSTDRFFKYRKLCNERSLEFESACNWTSFWTICCRFKNQLLNLFKCAEQYSVPVTMFIKKANFSLISSICSICSNTCVLPRWCAPRTFALVTWYLFPKLNGNLATD